MAMVMQVKVARPETLNQWLLLVPTKGGIDDI